MPTDITVNGITFAYPSPGQDPSWGQPATDLIVQMAQVINDLQGVDDIPEQSNNIANNQTTPENIVKLVFNPSTVRAASVNYSIYRINTQTFVPADVNTGTNTITMTGHVFVDGQGVVLTSTGTLPAGLASNTQYYIVNAAANTFQLSLTINGTPIDITTQGTGTHTIMIELAEAGKFELVFKNNAPTNTKWKVGITSYGDDAGVTFSLSDSGQMSYTSTNINGNTYVGLMKFQASTLHHQ